MSKKTRSIAKLLCMCFLVFVLCGFYSISVQAAGNPTTTVTKKTLYVGSDNYQIGVKDTSKTANITYKSSDTKIASVTNKGVVTPKTAGKATITVTIKQNSKTYTSKITLTVSNPYISIKSNQSIIDNGSSVVFTAKAVGLKNTNIEWSSSDSSILKVDKKTGKVTGVKPGKAVITARDTISNKKSVLTVSVYYTQKQMTNMGYQVDKVKNSDGTFGYQMKNYTGKSKDLVIPYGITSIKYDFKSSNFNSIVFPDSLTSLDKIDLSWSSIKKVVLPSNVKSIPAYMFSSCEELQEINLPTTITKIGNGAFWGCKNLKLIQLPDSLTTIGEKAFKDTGLTEIALPKSVTKLGYSAFENCASLEKVDIVGNVTKIDEGTFQDCDALTEITLPDSVKSIGFLAFSRCRSLQNITMPKELKRIEHFAFRGCSSLIDIAIPDNVEFIGSSAFSNCYSLSKIKMSKNVKEIEDYVFNYTESLREFICEQDINNITWGDNPFANSGISKISLYLKGYRAIFSEDELKSCETLKRTLEEINCNEQDSDLEKIRKVHDWLVVNVSYSYKQYYDRLDTGRTMVDVVLNDRFAICASYARTFNTLVNALGIETKYVSSKAMNHGWSMVLLDDGCWYHVDVTWDDPGSNDYSWESGWLRYKHLVLNDEQMSKTHYGWQNEELPVCNGTKYMNYFDHNYQIKLN